VENAPPGFGGPTRSGATCSSSSGVFRGDDELLVDALIAASQEPARRAAESAPLPGFGRDLVPYFDPEANTWDEAGVNQESAIDTSGADVAAGGATSQHRDEVYVAPHGMTYVVQKPKLIADVKGTQQQPKKGKKKQQQQQAVQEDEVFVAPHGMTYVVQKPKVNPGMVAQQPLDVPKESKKEKGRRKKEGAKDSSSVFAAIATGSVFEALQAGASTVSAEQQAATEAAFAKAAAAQKGKSKKQGKQQQPQQQQQPTASVKELFAAPVFQSSPAPNVLPMPKFGFGGAGTSMVPIAPSAAAPVPASVSGSSPPTAELYGPGSYGSPPTYGSPPSVLVNGALPTAAPPTIAQNRTQLLTPNSLTNIVPSGAPMPPVNRPPPPKAPQTTSQKPAMQLLTPDKLNAMVRRGTPQQQSAQPAAVAVIAPPRSAGSDPASASDDLRKLLNIGGGAAKVY